MALGEQGFETDTRKLKIGDGSTAWTALLYQITASYQPLSINAQTGTAYTLVLTDAGNNVQLTNAGAITLTVPPNSAVAFAIGDEIVLDQNGAGQVTFAPGAGVTINSAGALLSLTGQYSAATLIKKATDVWLLIGDLA